MEGRAVHQFTLKLKSGFALDYFSDNDGQLVRRRSSGPFARVDPDRPAAAVAEVTGLSEDEAEREVAEAFMVYAQDAGAPVMKIALHRLDSERA